MGTGFCGGIFSGHKPAFCLGILELRVFLALLGGGCLIAAVGWLDDRRGLSALVRLCFHFVAAIWAVS